ncbi:MAG: hypothetical protein ACSHX8_01555 [Opitutaceae bacterium]
MKSNFLILISLTCLVISVTANGVRLPTDSSFWPPKVKLTDDLVVSDAVTIPAGRHAVLIRVEEDGEGQDSLVLDFASLGIQRVAPGRTDVLQRVERYVSGRAAKSCPNWTMMLGRAFVRIHDGRIEAIKLSALSRYKYMLILYADELDQPDIVELLNHFTAVADSCGEEIMLVVMPQGLTGATESDAAAELSIATSQEFFYVYPYLSDAYTASLAHGVVDLPALVLVDVEGKTIIDEAPLSECFDAGGFCASYRAFFKGIESANP